VPTRQANMQGWEILLSESQERMLVMVKKGREAEVQRIFDKWDLNCAQIGEVTEGNTLQYFMHGELLAEVPAASLVLGGGAPVYHREFREPAYFQEYKKFDVSQVKEPNDLVAVAKMLAEHPNICSRSWIYKQYDSMVGTINMSTNQPTDAAIVNIKDSERALAFTVDCNSRYVHADPETGCAIAVAEAARNITCSGGEPSAITNCLNFGNPYNPEAYWQFVGSIKGMGKACEKFNTPVTGGNVSFYNQTVLKDRTEPVFPTPTIGMMGLVKHKAHITPLGFQNKGELIYLIGEVTNDLAQSQYLVSHHGITASPAPHFDLDKEYAMQQKVRELIQAGALRSAHDVSEGGLFITLLEKSMPMGLGFDIETDLDIRPDAFLFGEGQGRVVVSLDMDQEEKFLAIMKQSEVPYLLLGHVTKGKLDIDGESFGFVHEYKEIYDNALSRKMAH
jgi:phosphoribosylformylglycinamidine synthase subunit PurL